MFARVIEEEFEDLEPYLHGRFSNPLRCLIFVQSFRPCESLARVSTGVLLKKLLVYTSNES